LTAAWIMSAITMCDSNPLFPSWLRTL
jgi:hypothetical protein